MQVSLGSSRVIPPALSLNLLKKNVYHLIKKIIEKFRQLLVKNADFKLLFIYVMNF